MTILAPLVLAAIGGLVYLLATPPKVQEMGRCMWHAALIAVAFGLADNVVRLTAH